ncbi:MAG TPA: HAD domain-containing protein [Solirubrobacteraceae bacterium]|nr:HAD domain-containing protein [Solirubrobacteraceae bacterium]
MVDIDGVISLFGVPQEDDGGDNAPRGGLHAVDGTVHFLSATAAGHLLELSELYDLVWASGWEERAEEHLPRLLGLPSGLPYLRFGREPGNAGAHWKLEAIERFSEGRPLAWVDDCFNDACHRWAATRTSPTLLVTTEPRDGLTARESTLLREWAIALDYPGTGAGTPAASRAETASETAAP